VKPQRSITRDDVPNILAYLSWHVPIEGAVPDKKSRDQIECGRMAILDICRQALEGEREE
jgi:hypothetical protein